MSVTAWPARITAASAASMNERSAGCWRRSAVWLRNTRHGPLSRRRDTGLWLHSDVVMLRPDDPRTPQRRFSTSSRRFAVPGRHAMRQKPAGRMDRRHGPEALSVSPGGMREPSLVAQARDGDETAWAAIVELHWQAVWSLSRRIVRDQQGAEEVTQETFRVIKERLGEYRGQGALCAWIQVICRHQALDELRRRRRHAREVCIDECADVRARPVAIEERMVQRIDLERALALLAEEEREALLLTE